ncbi:hypothetical protein KM546_gp30 [Porcine lymphotropic herpesvirus 3]|uniref:Protein UL95 n=1 Tax=Suid gammaherpesvirus 5 TaxID=1960251 RepID=Q8B3Y8_9GAMA|nr:hypothetical protein KM546_gp30 [Porcine lymphotropic herpesvirus 3]AAO12337.1 unknown [Porcine lymphotropic herpesvirus 3]
MFNLSMLQCNGDPELSKKYKKGVELALRLAETSPGQFKLIESPINSFLIVTNISPDDDRSWDSTVSYDRLDFKSIHLPRLALLRQLVTYKQNDTTDKEEVRMTRNIHGPYITYDKSTWQKVLETDKTVIINEALELLSSPEQWLFCYPTDPLPWLWLLFYGPKSFCTDGNCLYAKFFHNSGLILFPPIIYQPSTDISSFMNMVCKYVCVLYKNQDLSKLIGDQVIPFDRSRLENVQSLISDMNYNDIHVTKLCLLCALYKQNQTTYHNVEHNQGCIILECAEKYINNSVGRTKCLHTGDIVLWPSYNIAAIVQHFKSHGKGTLE